MTRGTQEFLIQLVWAFAVVAIVVASLIFSGCATPLQQARAQQLCRAERDEQLRRIQQLGMRCQTDDCRQQLAVEYRYVRECE